MCSQMPQPRLKLGTLTPKPKLYLPGHCLPDTVAKRLEIGGNQQCDHTLPSDSCSGDRESETRKVKGLYWSTQTTWVCVCSHVCVNNFCVCWSRQGTVGQLISAHWWLVLIWGLWMTRNVSGVSVLAVQWVPLFSKLHMLGLRCLSKMVFHSHTCCLGLMTGPPELAGHLPFLCAACPPN